MAAGGKEMEIAIKIAGKVESSFKTALSAATKGLGNITKAVGAATAAAAAAVGAIGVAAINVGKEFETSMSQVAATMLIDKTTAEGQKSFETLENAARECGRSTAFSATEAAEALNYLALAGYDADKAAAALPTVLNLAGAGAMELADASNMVTDAMSALSIEATEKNLNSFADNLAMTASKSNTSVSELGDAILTVGGTAKYLAGGTTELSTCIGLLADNGIHASEGGTKLRNMITSLTAPTDKAAAALNKLGVSVFDSKGNMREMQDIFQDLNKATSGMSTKESSNVLSSIFNKTDLKAVNALLGTSTERWDELSGVIEDSVGACEEMYAIQLDNLDGDISILKSGLSDLGISIYKDLNEPLREMTQLATSMVEELSEAYESGGMEGMVGAVGDCLSEVVNVAADYAPKVVSMGVSLLKNFISGITDNSGEISDAAADVLSIFVEGLFDLVPQVILAGIDIITGFAESITKQLPRIITSGTQAVMNFVNGVLQRLPVVVTMALTLVQTLVNSIGGNASQLLGAAIQLIGGLLNGVITMLPQIANMAIQLVTSLAEAVLENVPLLIDTAVQLVLNLVNGILSMLPQILQSGIQLAMSLLQGIIVALPQIAQAGVRPIQGLVQSLVSNLPMILQAAMQLVMQLIQGIVEMYPTLVNEGIQLVSSIMNGVSEALPTILQMATQLVVQFITGIAQMLPDLLQMGVQLVTNVITGIAQNLPEVIGTAVKIILSIKAGFISAMPQVLKALGQMLLGIIDAILSTNWLQVGVDILTAIKDGILNTATSVGSAIKDSVLSFFGFGGGDSSEAAKSGAATASDYADGISSNMGAISSVANNMATTAFGGVNTAGATTAGTQVGTAFSTGLTSGMTAGSLDTTAFTAGISNGLAGTTVNTESLSVDTSGLNTALATAGTDGATAIGDGLADNSQTVTQAATALGTEVNTALDSGWNKVTSNARTAMQNLTSIVTTAARSAAEAVKSAFENMTITIPKPKLPVINVSSNPVPYGENGNISVPNFSVSWNALGGIFDQPTIFNTSAGMQGVGEAGPEAVLPLDTLWTKMKEILNGAMAANGGASVIEALLEKLQGIGTGAASNTPELVGAEGQRIVWNPVYNLYGNAGKEEVMEANRMSQAEFNRMMKQYKKDKKRRDL